MILLDTSVLMPIALVDHTHHRASTELFNFLTPSNSAISAHAIAETYASLTAMPPAQRLSPTEVVTVIDVFLKRLTPIALSPEEYLQSVRGAAKLGHTSGMIYDALHLACARKIEAEYIYTWNLKHFRILAPDLAGRILTP